MFRTSEQKSHKSEPKDNRKTPKEIDVIEILRLRTGKAQGKAGGGGGPKTCAAARLPLWAGSAPCRWGAPFRPCRCSPSIPARYHTSRSRNPSSYLPPRKSGCSSISRRPRFLFTISSLLQQTAGRAARCHPRRARRCHRRKATAAGERTISQQRFVNWRPLR